MIDIEDRHLKIVKDILAQYPYLFYVYGSRAKNKANKKSDLDLCYKDEIPENIIFQIKDLFEESDLPYTVDIASWDSMSETFQKLIEKDLKPITF